MSGLLRPRGPEHCDDPGADRRREGRPRLSTTGFDRIGVADDRETPRFLARGGHALHSATVWVKCWHRFELRPPDRGPGVALHAGRRGFESLIAHSQEIAVQRVK